ncbi:hypothetical protein B0T25DRAFT_618282, partial [Lasiosphaeria hispida]
LLGLAIGTFALAFLSLASLSLAPFTLALLSLPLLTLTLFALTPFSLTLLPLPLLVHIGINIDSRGSDIIDLSPDDEAVLLPMRMLALSFAFSLSLSFLSLSLSLSLALALALAFADLVDVGVKIDDGRDDGVHLGADDEVVLALDGDGEGGHVGHREECGEEDLGEHLVLFRGVLVGWRSLLLA